MRRPEGHPEFELYDHRADPLNTTDVAMNHPEKVEVLAREIELWEKWTESVALINESGETGGETGAEMSEAELEALRQLGYVGGDWFGGGSVPGRAPGEKIIRNVASWIEAEPDDLATLSS